MSYQDDLFIKTHVLTVMDVVARLGVSKTAVHKMINTGKIVPARASLPILFSLSEIERYESEEQSETFMTDAKELPLSELPAGETIMFNPQLNTLSGNWSFLIGHLPAIDSIEAIRIYEEEIDAAWNGYCRKGNLLGNDLYTVDAPTMVIEGKNKNQIWLKGFTCYGENQGTKAALQVLESLALRQKIELPRGTKTHLKTASMVVLYKDMDDWEVSGKQESRERKQYRKDSKDAFTLYKEEHLVLMVPESDETDAKEKKRQFIENFAAEYMNEPLILYAYKTPEDARSEGAVGYLPDGSERPYQIHVYDMNQNGVWFEDLPDAQNGYDKSETLKEILSLYPLAIKSYLETTKSRAFVPLIDLFDPDKEIQEKPYPAKIIQLAEHSKITAKDWN